MISPKTKPNASMQKKIAVETNRLFRCFSPTFLAIKTGIKIQTVCCHQSRKKISHDAAIAYCSVFEVSLVGFTKEKLRPDIKNWCI
jgi:hypothetical protein